MDELISVIQDVENLHGVLIKLKEKQEAQAGNTETDFERLYHYAKSAPITGHKLAEQDAFLRRSYLRMLAGLVSQTGEIQRREKKIIHIGRILAAMPDGALESIFADAATIAIKDLDDFRESLPEELRLLFLFDLLLLCWVDGEPEEAELRYATEFMNMFAIPEAQSEALLKAVKAVLEQDQKALFEASSEMESSLFLCYLDQSRFAVVGSLEEARKITGKPVIIFGADISKLRSPVDLDTFSAPSVEFRDCLFSDIKGFFAMETPVKIIDCLFEDCEVEQNLLALCNAEIRDTDFVRCKAAKMDNEQFYLIACRESVITGCLFQKQSITYISNNPPVGGLFGVENTTVTNCEFQGCKAHIPAPKPDDNMFLLRLRILGGRGSYISIKDGEMTRCRFKDCTMSMNGAITNIKNIRSVINRNTPGSYNVSGEENPSLRTAVNISAIIKAQRELQRRGLNEAGSLAGVLAGIAAAPNFGDS